MLLSLTDKKKKKTCRFSKSQVSFESTFSLRADMMEINFRFWKRCADNNNNNKLLLTNRGRAAGGW